MEFRHSRHLDLAGQGSVEADESVSFQGAGEIARAKPLLRHLLHGESPRKPRRLVSLDGSIKIDTSHMRSLPVGIFIKDGRSAKSDRERRSPLEVLRNDVASVSRASRLLAIGTAPGRMVADRMASRGIGTYQVLAVHPAV